MSDPADREAAELDEAEQRSEALEVAGSTAPGSSSLLGAALLGSGATLVVGALGVLRTKVLAVGLEPEGLGLYGQILTLLAALSAASGLGLGLGTTRVVAERRALGDRPGLKSALEVSFVLPLAVASALALAIAACSGVLASLLLNDDRPLLILLAALVMPGIALQGPLVHALQGFRDVAGAQGSNVFFGATLTLGSIVGVVALGLEGAVLGLVFGNLAYAAALAWRTRALLRQAGVNLALRAGLRWDRLREPVIKGMIAIGFASLFVGVVAGLSELAVRTFVLRGDSAAAAGIFQALQLISVQLLGVIVASVVFLSFTAISEAHAAKDRDRVRRTIDDTLRLALLLVLPMLMVLGLFRNEVVRVLLSTGFSDVSELLPRQLVGDALRTIAFALGAALVPLGMTRSWVVVTCLTAVGYVALSSVLVPAHGVDGAVVAYIVEWAAAAILTAALLIRHGRFAPSALTARTLLAALAFGAAAFLLDPGWPLALVTTATFAGVLVAVGTAQDERAALASRLRATLDRGRTS